ncbi:hypothetical protein [Evansella cellulosilytica]|uniref:Uncharacterized protein n=1 Tax=Evansella cellulosilytica (strain ATCC 21833 / DSM 2522 / FERM P-1141 / JCM 9156 / N-4) TaxID=649639 RepID=E6TVK3_EVAC2|nr:hypothetical protein [Evansella cellulosilytica]ADU32131.1 hypothetical protein Bcell_3892 [Evansella cellulosilytica DSM 2522]
MFKLFSISFTALLFIVGCSGEDGEREAIVEEPDEEVQEEIEEPEETEEEKEEKSIADKAIFTFELYGNRADLYSVYIYADDAQIDNDLVTGDFKIATQAESSDDFIEHDTMLNGKEQRFLLEHEFSYKAFPFVETDAERYFVLSELTEEDKLLGHFFYIEDEEVKELETINQIEEENAFLFDERFELGFEKIIVEGGNTWEYDGHDKTLIEIDMMFLNHMFKDRIREGYLPPMRYRIGNHIEYIIGQEGEPEQDDYWRGGRFHSWGNDMYFFSEQSKEVTSLEYVNDGSYDYRYDDFVELLGEPFSEGEDMLDGGYLVSFDVEGRTLSVNFKSEEDEFSFMMLN